MESLNYAMLSAITQNGIDTVSDLSEFEIIADCFPVLELFPVLNAFVKALKGIKNVNDYLFLKKTKEFLRAIDCINEEERNKRKDFFDKHTKEDNELLSTSIISIIDKAISEYKALVCGLVFKKYFYGSINYSDTLFCNEVILALSTKYLEKLSSFNEEIDKSKTSDFLNAIEAVGIVNSFDINGDDIIDANQQNNSEKYKLTREGLIISEAVKEAGVMVYI